MKNLFFSIMVIASVLGQSSCEKRPAMLEIDNSLTAAEVEAARLTPEVMWKMARAGAPTLSPDGKLLLYTLTRYNMQENRGVTVVCVQNIADGKVAYLTDTSENCSDAVWYDDGKYITYLSDRSGTQQVWRMKADGKRKRQLSFTEGDIEGYGMQPEGKGMFYIASTQVAARKSADIYKDMDKSRARIYDDLMCRHWNYWDEGSYRHIFYVEKCNRKGFTKVIDVTGPDAEWDTPLAPYFDTAEIKWSADGKYLAYTCKPLTGKEYAMSTDSDIFLFDTERKASFNICKALYGNVRFNAMVEHKTPFEGYDKYPVFSPDSRRVAFISMAEAGYEADIEHLMLYNIAKASIEPLTPDFDYSVTNVEWADDNTLYFISPINGTHQLCRLLLADRKVEVLTSGDHDITAFTLANGRCVAALTTISSATEYYDVNLADGTLTKISDINGNIYNAVRMGKVEKRYVTTTDGQQMLTWVVLPPDFDPAKKYPALLFCEGGPQSVVSQAWSYRWNFQLMAAKGYIVVAPNRRGCPSFGSEWLKQISGDYSGQNIRDYLSAIDNVAAEPWCDKEHLGCVGASYGGYSVFYLAGCHQKRFKAFISHCGIFDFDSMYGHTEELFFVDHDYGGAYWENEKPVAVRSYANSPHKSVRNWDTPIMIVTGEQDFRIPYTQSLEAFTAARLMGVDARLVEFENEAHQVFKPQNSMVWNREFFGWLDKYLK